MCQQLVLSGNIRLYQYERLLESAQQYPKHMGYARLFHMALWILAAM